MSEEKSSSSSKITVHNDRDEPIWASINKWGDDGDTSYFAIKPGDYESWDRSDKRGFVLTLKETSKGAATPYYIHASDRIEVSKNAITADNAKITPCGPVIPAS